MKVWKAMIKGAKMKPQCFGAFYDNGGSCVMGAVRDVLGPWAKCVPELLQHELMQNCPVCEHKYLYAFTTAVPPHLNDDHKWSREAIAEWVKTIEDKITQEKWNKRKQQRNLKETSYALHRHTESKRSRTESVVA